MQSSEFDQWLKGHISAFPSLREWIRRNADCLESWRDCLAELVLADAVEATRLLNLGDEEQPKGYGDHARVVRRIAKRLAFSRRPVEQEASYIGGERTFRCPTCQDTGLIEVANIWKSKHGGKPLRAFWAGEVNHIPICMVGCDCGAHVPRGLPIVDRERMFLVDKTESVLATAERFRVWWSEGHRYGRTKDFDDWNQSAAQQESMF